MITTVAASGRHSLPPFLKGSLKDLLCVCPTLKLQRVDAHVDILNYRLRTSEGQSVVGIRDTKASGLTVYLE